MSNEAEPPRKNRRVCRAICKIACIIKLSKERNHKADKAKKPLTLPECEQSRCGFLVYMGFCK